MEDIVIPFLFIGTGILIAAIAHPLRRRKVSPNAFMGVRVRATLEDESIWYDVNAASGEELFRFGVLLFSVSVVLWVLGTNALVFATIGTLVALIGGVAVSLRAISLANRLWEERHSRPSGSVE